MMEFLEEADKDLTLSTIARAIVEKLGDTKAREIARLINYYL